MCRWPRSGRIRPAIRLRERRRARERWGSTTLTATWWATGVLDVTASQIVIYEPTPTDTCKLIGADYLVFADAWDAKHPAVRRS